METNWRRCFSALVALAVVLSAVAPAAAVDAGGATPATAEVGTEVEATVTLTDLYRDPAWESWKLAGETELKNVVWTVRLYDQTGSQIDRRSFDGRRFAGATVATEDGTSEIRVTVTGTVRSVGEYSYDPAQSTTLLTLSQVRPGGANNELVERTVRPYTAESAAARERLDEAAAAVDRVGDDDAAEWFGRAVSAYENENFELTSTLASEAESRARAAERSDRRERLLFYGAGGTVALALLVGGIFVYLSRRNAYDRLG